MIKPPGVRLFRSAAQTYRSLRETPNLVAVKLRGAAATSIRAIVSSCERRMNQDAMRDIHC